MAIRKPLVVGMGRVGSLIALLLSDLGMQVAGVDMHQGPSIPDNVEFTSADVTDPRILARLCQGRDAVIACLPYPLIKQEDIPLRAWLNTTTGDLFAAHHPALRAV